RALLRPRFAGPLQIVRQRAVLRQLEDEAVADTPAPGLRKHGEAVVELDDARFSPEELSEVGLTVPAPLVIGVLQADVGAVGQVGGVVGLAVPARADDVA